MNGYNGYQNWQTWNVSLWVANDEPLYRCAVAYTRRAGKRASWTGFVRYANLEGHSTPDGARFDGRKLCRSELSAMLRELAA